MICVLSFDCPQPSRHRPPRSSLRGTSSPCWRTAGSAGRARCAGEQAGGAPPLSSSPPPHGQHHLQPATWQWFVRNHLRSWHLACSEPTQSLALNCFLHRILSCSLPPGSGLLGTNSEPGLLAGHLVERNVHTHPPIELEPQRHRILCEAIPPLVHREVGSLPFP